MSPELEKTIKDMNFGGPYHEEQNDKAFFESGWKAARDKIVEILRKNASKEDRLDDSQKYMWECQYIYDLDKVLEEVENL